MCHEEYESDTLLSTAKSLYDFDRKNGKLNRAYVKKSHGLQRLLEIAHMKGPTQYKSENRPTPLDPSAKSKPKHLFISINIPHTVCQKVISEVRV